MTLARANNRDTVPLMLCPVALTWSAICVFTVTPSKIKMQTSRYTKSLIWEIKEDEYKPRQGSGLCDNSYARYSEKRFTQIYKGFVCRRHVGVPLRGTNMRAAANQQKHLFLSFPTYAKIHRLRNS